MLRIFPNLMVIFSIFQVFSLQAHSSSLPIKLKGHAGSLYNNTSLTYFGVEEGVSENRIASNGAAIGMYAKGNFFTLAKAAFKDGSIEQKKYLNEVAQNFVLVSEALSVPLNNIVILASQYGKGNDPYLIDRDNFENQSYLEELTPEVNIRKIDGDVIITADPALRIGIVGADAHPISIRATTTEGTPVVSLVVGSHQGLLQYGLLAKALHTLKDQYRVDMSTVQIDVGPGLDSSSICCPIELTKRFSRFSFEIGLDLAKKYEDLSKNNGKYGNQLQFFKGPIPLFKEHPTDKAKSVFSLEALLAQTLEHFGINLKRVHYTSGVKFFSARKDIKKIDLEEYAKSHPNLIKLAADRGISPKMALDEKLDPTALYQAVGRNLTVSGVTTINQEKSK